MRVTLGTARPSSRSSTTCSPLQLHCPHARRSNDGRLRDFRNADPYALQLLYRRAFLSRTMQAAALVRCPGSRVFLVRHPMKRPCKLSVTFLFVVSLGSLAPHGRDVEKPRLLRTGGRLMYCRMALPYKVHLSRVQTAPSPTAHILITRR